MRMWIFSENVDEYLRMTNNLKDDSDNPQLLRVKQMFEKKNNKTAQNIMQLQVGIKKNFQF